MQQADAAIDRQDAPEPRVWLLTGYRAGDNAQVLALAEALGWRFEIKRFVYRRYEFLTNRLLGRTLAGIVPEESSPLAPPWPDLIISAGRRNEPIARWIQAQSRGRTRLVHLGRPWADPAQFDLVVTTPQYRVPDGPHVLQIEAPLHRVNADRLAEARRQWQALADHLPRPLVALLVGGDSPPYVFDVEMAQRLGREVSAFARARGGSLMVTTSPRTRKPSAAALQGAIEVPCRFYDWTADPRSNPYLGYLALADAIIVTGESMSMVAEACATGRPVHVFDMGRGWTSMRPPGHPRALASRGLADSLDPTRMQHWLLAHILPSRVRRDVRTILRRFVAEGWATWLGDEAPASIVPPPADLARTVARIRALFDDAARR